LAKHEPLEIRRLENPAYFLDSVSRTFHGRDVFAPVAAHLSLGVAWSSLGPEAGDYVRLEVVVPRFEQEQMIGTVVYIDHFGNAITNLPHDAVAPAKAAGVKIRLPGRKIEVPLGDSYSAVAAGQPVAVLGSSGYVEIAVNGGSAVQALGLKINDAVVLRNW
jgi:hypothetical protein